MGLGVGSENRAGWGQCNRSGRPSPLSKHPGDVAGSKSPGSTSLMDGQLLRCRVTHCARPALLSARHTWGQRR